MKAFDTDVLTEVLLGDPTYVARAAMIPPHEQAVPVVVIEELLRGRLHVIRQAEAGQAKVDLSRAYALFEQTLRDVRQMTVLSYTPQAEGLYQLSPRSFSARVDSSSSSIPRVAASALKGRDSARRPVCRQGCGR